MSYQNACYTETAVGRIEANQLFVSVAALDLFPLDAKRMAGEDVTPTPVALVKAIPYGSGCLHYDALLALTDTFLSRQRACWRRCSRWRAPSRTAARSTCS